jgi:hypothetical protein
MILYIKTKFFPRTLGNICLAPDLLCLFKAKDDIDSVHFYLDKALALPIEDPWLLRSISLLRFEIAEKEKNYPEALKSHIDYYDYTIKVFNNEENNKLLELQEKYDYEKLKDSQNQLIIKHQRALFATSLLILAAVIVIGVYYRKLAQNVRRLEESEQKAEQLQKTVNHFSKKNRDVLHQLAGIFGKTALLEIDFSKSNPEDIKKLIIKINNIVYKQDQWNWDLLYQVLDNAQNGLYSKIKKKYKQLSEVEFQICCLTCEMNFSDKDIEKIVGEPINKIHRIRSELRKKLGMAERENFLVFFEKRT